MLRMYFFFVKTLCHSENYLYDCPPTAPVEDVVVVITTFVTTPASGRVFLASRSECERQALALLATAFVPPVLGCRLACPGLGIPPGDCCS